MNLTERFLRHHAQSKLFEEGDRVLIALSGGKDSVCLLSLLFETKERLGIRIGACHIQHKLREDAEQDLEFCRALCQRMKIPFYAEYADIPAFCAQNGLGVEEGARMERYRLLDEVARREGYQKIATAHTASDQAETVLFRLTRGSGMHGLKGIYERRGFLIRPLLSFFSEEILAYLESNHLLFTEDSSNADILYARNRLRHCVLPELKQINEKAEDALVRLSEIADQHAALCDALCERMEKECGFSAEDGAIPLSHLSRLTECDAGLPVLHAILSKMAQKENITIDHKHFNSLVSLLKNPVQGKIIEISDGFCFFTEKDLLCFRKNESVPCDIQYQVEVFEGDNEIAPLNECLSLSRSRREKLVNINKKGLIISFSSDKIKGRIFARNFQNGDRIFMYGMTKSVKKLLCDAGIPRALRKSIPMVCDEDEIIWIPLVGLCDKARDESSERIATFHLFGEGTKALLPFSGLRSNTDKTL